MKIFVIQPKAWSMLPGVWLSNFTVDSLSEAMFDSSKVTCYPFLGVAATFKRKMLPYADVYSNGWQLVSYYPMFDSDGFPTSASERKRSSSLYWKAKTPNVEVCSDLFLQSTTSCLSQLGYLANWISSLSMSEPHCLPCLSFIVAECLT